MYKDLLDEKKLERVAREFLEIVDPNPDREGLKETPHRVAKYWMELLEGQKYTNQEIADMYNKTFSLEDKNDDGDESNMTTSEITSGGADTGLVMESGISIFSHCEHHLALMYDMDVTVAYIPNKKVIGISKIARVAEMCAKRLQLQEKLGQDIAEVLKIILGTDDVAVIIKGKHACMTARGVKAREAVTKTSALYGRFMTNPQLRAELLALKNSKD